MARRKEPHAEEKKTDSAVKEQMGVEFQPEGDAARSAEASETKEIAKAAPASKSRKKETEATASDTKPKAKRATAPKKPAAKKEQTAEPETVQTEPAKAESVLQLTAKRERAEESGAKQQAHRTNLPTATVKGQEVVSSTVPIRFPDDEKRSFLSRVLVLLALMAVLVASVLIFAFRPAEYAERTNSVNFFYLPESDETVIAVNGTVRDTVSGALRYKTYDSTGRVCAALVEDRLYLIEGRKVNEISSEVSDCVLSTNGKVIAYRTESDELYYAIVGEEDGASRISGSTKDAHYCLSPDGKELFYTYERDDVLRVDVYSRTGNKPYFSQDEGLYPVAVANDCRYLYYVDEDGVLYVLVTKTGDKVVCGDAPDLSGLIFNRDCSEMMFCNGTETRLFVNGERMLIPDLSSTETLQLMANRRVAVRELGVGRIYLMDSLRENYYLYYTGTAVKLVYLERKGELADISFVDDAQTVTVTDKWVFFLLTSEGDATHTNLYRCKNGKTRVESDPFWDVSAFCTNVDGSRILYTDMHGALFSCTIGSYPERLCDSVIEESMTVTADDAFYFYREEGSLWVSDNGGEPRAVRDDIEMLVTDGYTAYYVTVLDEKGLGTVYSNYRNSRKDTVIAEDVGGMG